MRKILCCVFLLIAFTYVTAKTYTFNDPNIPIRRVETSLGKGARLRINYLEAEILPRHLRLKKRVSFPPKGPLFKHFQAVRAPGDERGHLVASMFSGPPTWYNLTPQSPRVNRNAGFQALNTDWYGAECEVRSFLKKGGNRKVIWKVTPRYQRDSNRPDEYRLEVNFYVNGRDNRRAIDTWLLNPFLRENSRFWICRQCRANNHPKGDLRERSKKEGGCHLKYKHRGNGWE